MVENGCFRGRYTSALRAGPTRQCPTRPTGLPGPLRVLPSAARPPASHQPCLSIAGRRSGPPHHHHRGKARHPPARLDARWSPCCTGCNRHCDVSRFHAEFRCGFSRAHTPVCPIEERAVVEQSDSPEKASTGPDIVTASQGASDREDPAVVSRRWLLLTAGAALNGIVGLALAVPIVRYLLAPVRKDSSYKSWISLGSLSDFPIGETRLASYKTPFTRSWDGQTDNVACYVRREGASQFKVFAINCAHLGCPVRWFPQSQLFMCPCHGGVYYADGSRASGPPERGLFTYEYKIAGNELHISAGQTPTLSNEASNSLRV